jgi:D-alanine-D-alanine ligase
VKKTIAIIYGGRSGEHEISIRSAESIMNALDPVRYHVIRYFISKEGRWSPRPINPEPGRNPEIDVVFPVLHGTFGEDGTVQGLLELADLPYVSAGVLASSAAMDKEVAKRLMRDRGLPVVEYYLAGDGATNPFGYPVFVKPANLGSSVGISKASNEEELRGAVELARQYDRKVLVERGIVGQEIECSVLGNQDPVAAMPCEVLPFKEFYDYEDKYILDKTQFRIPPALPESKIEAVRRLAVECFRALECEIMARVDFLYEAATGKLYINEINTIPGFTSISMYPKMWDHAGLPYAKLLDQLVDLAIERQQRRRALKYSR